LPALQVPPAALPPYCPTSEPFIVAAVPLALIVPLLLVAAKDVNFVPLVSIPIVTPVTVGLFKLVWKVK
jgi:uncharacterized membrane protein